MKKRIGILILIMMGLLMSLSFGEMDDVEVTYEKAEVLRVIEQDPGEDGFVKQIQLVGIQFRSGPMKGQIMEIENVISDNYVYDLPVEKGDKIIVMVENYEDGSQEVYISDYQRDTYIIVLVVLFMLALIYVGKMKGLKTILTIFLTVFIIFKFMLPMILKGYSPMLLSIGFSMIITVITLFTIAGFNRKSLAATLGTILGVLIAGLLSFVIGLKVKLTGLTSEEATMLLYIPQGITFNFRELLFSGILLGALGAVMDVAMSISSSITELNLVNPALSWKQLYKSGMAVGKDIMGTMSNTLILAYTGSSLPLLILFMAYNSNFVKMVNLDLIATEIIRSLAGSIGLILTIPITAAITVLLIKE